MLDIVIPTFQPSQYLEATLESIDKAAVDLGDRTNVYLCLNGVTSNNSTTRKVLETKYQHINLISISSLNTNQPNLSLNFAISQSQSKFLWIMSDDDIVEKGAIKTVRQALIENQVCLAIANFSTINADGELLQKNTQNWHENYVYTADDINTSLIRANFCYGSFSSIIVGKHTWADTEFHSKMAPGGMNFLLQVPEIMSKHPHMLIGKPIYRYRMYEKRWQTDYNQTFQLDHITIPNIIRNYKKYGVSSITIKALLRRNYAGTLQSVYNLRLYGTLNA